MISDPNFAIFDPSTAASSADPLRKRRGTTVKRMPYRAARRPSFHFFSLMKTIPNIAGYSLKPKAAARASSAHSLITGFLSL